MVINKLLNVPGKKQNMGIGKRILLTSIAALGIGGIGLAGEAKSGSGWFYKNYEVGGYGLNLGFVHQDGQPYILGATYYGPCKEGATNEAQRRYKFFARDYHLTQLYISSEGIDLQRSSLSDSYACMQRGN